MWEAWLADLKMPQASPNVSSTIFGSQKRTRVPPIVSGHVDTSTVAKLSPSESFSDPQPPLRSGHLGGLARRPQDDVRSEASNISPRSSETTQASLQT